MSREESYQALLNTKGPHRAYVASAQSLVLACYVTRFDKVWWETVIINLGDYLCISVLTKERQLHQSISFNTTPNKPGQHNCFLSFKKY